MKLGEDTQMKLPGIMLALALALLVPNQASAAPISTGVWDTAAPTGDPLIDALISEPFWAGLSLDCPDCGIGNLINAYASPQIEYLNDGAGGYTPFKFDGPISAPLLVFNVTAWKGGTLDRTSDGTFTYDSYVRPTMNSWDNPEQFSLFRIVGPQLTLYFLGIEDIPWNEPLSDHDYNDFVVAFTSPTPTPEPSMLLLLGTSVVALAARKRFSPTSPTGN
jgi:hypothetical protein